MTAPSRTSRSSQSADDDRGGARFFGAPLSPLGTARLRVENEVWEDELPLEGPAARDRGDAAGAFTASSDVDPHDAFLASEFAGWATELSPDARATLASIVARLLGEVAQGSTRLPLSPSERALVSRVPTLVGAPGDQTPLVVVDNQITLHRLYAAEARLSAALAQRFASVPGRFSVAAIEAALATVVQTATPPPSVEQQAAVVRALGAGLGLITGGPGTGKTTIVLAMVRALVRLGIPAVDIALAAPTGKAANRLGEALREGLARIRHPDDIDGALLTSPPASETLHRLLRHSPSLRTFAHGEGAPLPHQVVIVDESSMIDLALMDRLFAALAPGTQLVLLGDADQLPSVEAGTVFRDIAARGVRLQQSHRMDPARPEGRRILALAAAVHAGSRDLAAHVDQRANAAALSFAGVELCPSASREAFLLRWFDERIRPSTSFTAIARNSFVMRVRSTSTEDLAAEPSFQRFEADVVALFDRAFAEQQTRRLLGVTRGRPTGVDAINAALHARWGARSKQPTPGEPVMMLRNDYRRGLWNGDQGLVISVRDPSPRTVVVFKVAGEWTPFPLESLRDSLGLAFALTVHKSQGSEYDEVALVLPETSSPLLTRDLVYTALTRSRRAVVICGDLPLLVAAAGTAPQRLSGLSGTF